MKSKRVKFIIEFEVDTDPVPGAWHDPQDWINHILWHFVDTKSPYNPKATVIATPIHLEEN